MTPRLGHSAVATDTGRRRRRNEDAYVSEPPLFAIADGMGGAQAGEIASRLAAAVLEEEGRAAGGGGAEARVEALIREANRRVFQRSSEDAATSGMGTTMTVALVDGSTGKIAFGHVGDSRAYRVRDGRLDQLTEDHSLVGELVRSGRISREEAETHPQRAVITRALGTEPDVDVDTFTEEAQPGDVYLLCSDGLTDMLGDREILAHLAEAGDLDTAARRLVEAANARGGEDNITVVVFQMTADGEDAPTQPADRVADPQPEVADDEDTLSGLERVPAIDTAVLRADELADRLDTEPQREQPDGDAAAHAGGREPSRRRILPMLLLLAAFAAIAVLVVWGLYR